MSYLENLYSQNMGGGAYVPFTSLDILNESAGGSGAGGSDLTLSITTPTLPIPTTPIGNDIKISLTNLFEIKNQMTFNVQGQTFQEGSSVALDSNTINDELIIKPIVNDSYRSKNYYGIKKTLTAKEIVVTDGGVGKDSGGVGNINRTETIYVTGINLITYNIDGSILGTTNYELPLNIDLGFDLENNVTINPDTITSTLTQTIQFISNYKNDVLNKEVEIKVTSNDITYGVNNTTIGNEIKFTNPNGILGSVKIELSGFDKFTFKNIRWQYTDKFGEGSDLNLGDFNVINDTTFNIDASVFTKNILILVEVEPNSKDYPVLTLDSNNINKSIAESIYASKTDSITLPVSFDLINTDFIKVKTPFAEFNYNVSATTLVKSSITLDLKKDFQNNEGAFKIALVPSSNLYGDGVPQYVIINLSKTFDTPIIDKIDYPTSVYIPSYTFGNVNVDISFVSNLATNSIVYYSKEDDNTIIGKFGAKDIVKLNYNDYKSHLVNSTLDILIVPYNKNIKGEIERIAIKFEDAGVYVSTPELKTNLFNAIASNLNINLGNEQKYLSHLATFDIDDKEILISNWDIDYTTFTKFKKDSIGNDVPDGEINKSIVLKLYEPLPANINKNDTLWVSRLMSLPIIQRVVVSSVPETNALPLRAPNFNIEVDYVVGQSTTYESYDDLILSGSETSQQIVDKVLSQNFVETDKINVDYSHFSNFVKYSSAVERLANFKYKVELAEYYQDRIVFLKDQTQSVSVVTDIQKTSDKLSTLVTGFDGWEKSLISGSNIFTADSASYSSFPGGRFNLLSGSNAFTNSGSVYLTNSNTTLSNWYVGTYDSASIYDNNNLNALKNNIPQFISDDDSNSDYMLFLDMIGNHFDIIWTHIKGMSDQRIITEDSSTGINDELLYNYLESLSWDAKNLNSNKNLWGYLFGQNGDGTNVLDDVDGYTITPEQYTKKVWRRIANNLPYLLKHKGTTRGIKALMSSYGIPQSALTIMEFGGPTNESTTPSTFTYETLSSTLVFNTGSYLTSSWDAGIVKAIQFRIKPEYSSSVDLVSGFDFKLYISGSNTNKQLGSLHLELEGDTVLSSSMYSFFDGNFHSILINNDYDGNYSAHYGYSDKDRIVKQGSVIGVGITAWCADDNIKVGNFNGELDEFRLWKEPLKPSIFDLHILGSELIVGNTMKSSTEDLLLRLDFEYPHSLYPSGIIKNVAPITTFMNDVSASGFNNALQYDSTTQQHWNYKYIDKDVTITLPNTGISRLTNDKIRFEDQTLISDLSPTKRATKKAFETSKMDSNRIGLFFSPNKDLDLDIAKSLGGDSLDNYIGDPSDEYSNTYNDLDTLREYYFERISHRNIYEFIRLIKFFDKSFFENVKEMLPARAKVTEGLLIAPHFLERSKIKRNKPTGVTEQMNGVITDTTITEVESTYSTYDSTLNLSASLDNISGIMEDYNTTIDATDTYNFTAEYDTYTARIDNRITQTQIGAWETYNAEIDFRRTGSTITTEFDLTTAGQIVGMDENYIEYGFNTMFNNGYGKYHYEENGVFKSKGVRGFIATKRNTFIYPSASVDGNITNVLTSSFSKKLIIQDLTFSGSLTTDTTLSNIITASGYLPSHHIYKGEKHTGVENLFYKGSKQTQYTTIDGKAAVETFTTNPTTLRVTAQGRSNNEPILEVD